MVDFLKVPSGSGASINYIDKEIGMTEERRSLIRRSGASSYSKEIPTTSRIISIVGPPSLHAIVLNNCGDCGLVHGRGRETRIRREAISRLP
jgi:hypothetical protein